MKARIVMTFGLTLMLVLGALGALAGLGVFDARLVLAANVTEVKGEVSPTDPGSVSKLTVRFTNDQDLDGGIDDITIKLEDDIKVPSVIDPSDVTITTTRFSNNVSGGTTGTVVANPLGITVKFTGVPKDDPEITLEIGDMEPSTSETGFQGIAGPCGTADSSGGSGCGTAATTVTIVFRQGAGITNPTEAEAGFDSQGMIKGRDVEVKTSKATTYKKGDAENLIFVPRLVDLSDEADKRGKVITVTGKGFANGTTATIWRDVDQDGTRDAGEVDLGQALVASDDTFTFSLTISVPPFSTTHSDNSINAIDGKSNTIAVDSDANGASSDIVLVISGETLSQKLSDFKLEGSFSVTPSTASIGDTVQVTIKDFIDKTWTKTVSGTVGAPKITLGGVLVNTPAVNPNTNGEATFNLDIPNGVPSGTQQLKIVAATGDYAANSPTTNLTISGAVVTLTPETNLVPNQTITVIGSGFTGSSDISATAGDDSSITIDGSANGLKTAGSDATGDDMSKINEGGDVDIDNGGNWSSSIILPINDTTTTPGTHELKITDRGGRIGTVSLVIAPRVLTLTPLESRVGTTVTVTGSGFPGDNTKTGAEATPSVSIKYTVGGTAQTVATLTPDASGNITGSFTVPLNAGIPSTNSVTAEFSYTETDASSATTSTTGVTHTIPRATVSIDPKSGPSGTIVTITGLGFKTYSTLSALTLGGIDVRPAPVPSTNNEGSFTTTVMVPQSNSGSQSVTATVASTVATDTYTVVASAPTATPSAVAVSQAPADALADVISKNDNLVRVWHFDPSTQSVAPDYGWFLYDPRPAYDSANNVVEIAGGKFYWIKVRDAQTVTLGGLIRSLVAGWNPVTW